MSSFTNFIEAALEADDLTRETRSMMRGTVRAAGQNPDTDDSIEGGGMDDLGGSGLDTEPSDNPDGADDGGMGDDFGDMDDPGGDPGGNMGDLGGGDPMGGGMDDGMGDMGGSDMISGADGAGEMSPKYAFHIVNLQTNAMALFNSVSAILTTLTEYSIPTSTPEVKRLYIKAMDHLTVIKQSLEDLLGSPFRVNTYASKMRKYMTLRHAYSLTLDQLNLYFEALNAENDRGPEKSP